MVLSTLAADHTKGLLTEGHTPVGALIGGYQLAFIAGAVAIGTGIVLAFVLLRPRDQQLELQPAATNYEIQEKAA